MTGDQDLPVTFYSECVSSLEEGHKQTSGERTVIVWPRSHFCFTFPAPCNIIMFFSCLHRDVFNKESSVSFAQ